MPKVLMNIIHGMGSVLVVAPTGQYRPTKEILPRRTDDEALTADVRNVGDDMRKAMNRAPNGVE